jgi:hypothetical protein
MVLLYTSSNMQFLTRQSSEDLATFLSPENFRTLLLKGSYEMSWCKKKGAYFHKNVPMNKKKFTVKRSAN